MLRGSDLGMAQVIRVLISLGCIFCGTDVVYMFVCHLYEGDCNVTQVAT